MALLAVAPAVIWHGLIGEIASRFRWQAVYLLTDWVPWLLLVGGVMFLIPVAFSAGRSPESRLYPRARRVYLDWGLALYLMGIILATLLGQVASLTD